MDDEQLLIGDDILDQKASVQLQSCLFRIVNGLSSNDAFDAVIISRHKIYKDLRADGVKREEDLVKSFMGIDTALSFDLPVGIILVRVRDIPLGAVHYGIHHFTPEEKAQAFIKLAKEAEEEENQIHDTNPTESRSDTPEEAL